MSASRQLTLQKAVQNISKTVYFAKRWVGVTCLVDAISTRYTLEGFVISKATVSRHLGKIEPDIDNCLYKHSSGVFRGIRSREAYYFFQNPQNDPPTFPPFKDKKAWENIYDENKKQLDLYIDNITSSQNRQTGTKNEN